MVRAGVVPDSMRVACSSRALVAFQEIPKCVSGSRGRVPSFWRWESERPGELIWGTETGCGCYTGWPEGVTFWEINTDLLRMSVSDRRQFRGSGRRASERWRSGEGHGRRCHQRLLRQAEEAVEPWQGGLFGRSIVTKNTGRVCRRWKHSTDILLSSLSSKYLCVTLSFTMSMLQHFSHVALQSLWPQEFQLSQSPRGELRDSYKKNTYLGKPVQGSCVEWIDPLVLNLNYK